MSSVSPGESHGRLVLSFTFQVVQTGSKNVELAIMKKGEPMRLLEVDEIEEYVKMIETEKEAEAEKKKAKKLAAQETSSSSSASS